MYKFESHKASGCVRRGMVWSGPATCGAAPDGRDGDRRAETGRAPGGFVRRGSRLRMMETRLMMMMKASSSSV